MDKKEYICIREVAGSYSYWKIGQKYEFDEYEIKVFETHIKLTEFKDWFLDKQEYREYIINKILNE